jgi:intracellular sulfur oxidation DsrE/DsrF family protein
MKMLTRITLLSVLGFASFILKAQQGSEVIDMKKHKIVFQFMDGDSASQVRMNLQVGNVRAAWPNADIEVVCQGAGIEMLMTAKSKSAISIADWTTKGVTFAACNNTMRLRNVKKEDLLSQAVVVPSAIVELAQKQEAGWSYIKGGAR